jgi:Ras-related protein Rab-1A
MENTQNNKHISIMKLVLIGASGVGKTTFCNGCTNIPFTYEQPTTIGVDFHVKNIQIDGEEYRLQIWDTAGHEKFHSVTRAYYNGAHIVLLCFDVSNIGSFHKLEFWLNELTDKIRTNDTLVFLIGMKSDLEHNVEINQIDEFMIKHNLLSYIEISTKKEQKCINNMLSKIISKTIFHRREFMNKHPNSNNYDSYNHEQNVIDPYNPRSVKLHNKISNCCTISS